MCIGWQCSSSDSSTGCDEEAVEVKVVQAIMLPVVGGEDSVAHMLWEQLMDIQEGRIEWEGWGVPCTVAGTEGPGASTISTPTPSPNNADIASQRH